MANPTTGTLVKDSTVRVPVRRVLTVHERKALETQKDVFGYGNVNGDNYENGASGFSQTSVPWMNVKRPRLNEQQAQVMKVLREQSPEPTSPDEREAIDRRCAALKGQFEPWLQTSQELRSHSHRDPVFMSALKKAREWNKPQKDLNGRTPEEVCEEYRNLKRRLEPDNPESDSLEELRKPK
jgi:hypothetical protein